MNGNNSPSRRKAGLFERLGLVDDDGETVRITPHQLRHYMTTLANEGNMSELDIARWAGRKGCPAQRILRHETADSLVSKARALDEDMFGGRYGNPSAAGDGEAADRGRSRRSASDALRRLPARLCDVALPDVPRLPELRRTCLRKGRRASGAGLAGSPCRHRESGRVRGRGRAIGEGNSEIWLSRKRIELARLRQLVALIDDAAIEPGAILRLNDAAHYGVGRDGTDPAKTLSDPGLGSRFLPPARESMTWPGHLTENNIEMLTRTIGTLEMATWDAVVRLARQRLGHAYSRQAAVPACADKDRTRSPQGAAQTQRSTAAPKTQDGHPKRPSPPHRLPGSGPLPASGRERGDDDPFAIWAHNTHVLGIPDHRLDTPLQPVDRDYSERDT